jgi:rhodanese-related sulfurtransferase
MMKQHNPRFLALISETKKQIKEITPQALKTLIDSKKPFYLIDVRDEGELSSGRIPNAIHLSKGVIERDIEKQIDDQNQKVVLYCSGGFRCALAALSLQQMGYSQVYSLDTGLQGWIEAGYPIEP